QDAPPVGVVALQRDGRPGAGVDWYAAVSEVLHRRRMVAVLVRDQRRLQLGPVGPNFFKDFLVRYTRVEQQGLSAVQRQEVCVPGAGRTNYTQAHSLEPRVAVGG